MIGYLPTIYDGELLGSWISRAYAHSPYISSSSFRKTIFSKENESLDYHFYNSYNSEFKQLLEDTYGLYNLINNHTLFTYYSAFLPTEKKRAALQMALDLQPFISKNISYPLRQGKTLYVRYCPLCVKSHKEPYFVREAQIEINYCPTHFCHYRNTQIKIDKEKLIEFKSMDQVDFDFSNIEIINENDINIRVAKYITEFINAKPNYDNNVPIGAFLSARIENTIYIKGHRGGEKNLDLLLSDLNDFYQGLETFRINKSRLALIMRGKYINVYDILLISFFLHINIQDLIHPYLPPKSQLELFDNKVLDMHKQGKNYLQISKELNVDKETIRQICLGTYFK